MEIQTLGTQPISPEKPSGEDVRYEPVFDELQQEIDKLSIPSLAAEGVNWKHVEQLGSKILAEQSKNLLVAAYLALACIHRQQEEGLAQGANLLSDLIENFWDTLWPEKRRLRGRLKALEWWIDRAETHFSQREEVPLESHVVESAKKALDRFDSAIAQKTDNAPLVSRLRSNVDRWPIIETKASDAPGESTSSAKDAGPVAGGSVAATTPSTVAVEQKSDGVEVPEDPKGQIRVAFRILSKAAGTILKQDLSSPVSYSLERTCAWTNVERLPLAESGTTRLAPPPQNVRMALENLYHSNQFEEVVVEAESKIGQYIFWLDLSRFTYQALEQLGPRFAQAQKSVAANTAQFVSRLSQIEDLAFSDGTPFADPETKSWLKSLTNQSQAQTLSMDSSEAKDDELGLAINQANELMKNKKHGEALEIFEQGLRRISAGCDKLRWRLALVRLLNSTGRQRLARATADRLLASIDQYKLEEYDPTVALEILLAVYQGVSGDRKQEEKATAILDRIALLRPSVALRMIK